MGQLKDSHGRQFHYLRLSVTDACNFRCIYCLPHGFKKTTDDAPLSVSEITNLVRGFVEMGFWKFRLTGGEPTVRRDIVEIAKAVSAVPGVKKLAMTTNGFRLKELAYPLKAAGVHALNVSVDSLDRENFEQITGTKRFDDVMAGVRAAFDAGFESIKVNTVLMKGWNDTELDAFLEWIKEAPISIRFIELMRTGDNQELYGKRHVSGGTIQLSLFQRGFKMLSRKSGDGPAVEFAHPDYQGRIGIIAPYSKDFCQTCNRLRVSSQGGLRLCLFGEKDFSLRPWIQDESQKGDLIRGVSKLIEGKPETHLLHEGKYGNTWEFASIGG